MEYVTVDQFREYYGLKKEEVTDDFLKGYIKDRSITMCDLERRDWAKVVKVLYSRGVTYGHNITTMIQKKYRYAELDENFEMATHIIVQMEIVKEYGLCEPCYFVIDREDNILYYSEKEIRLDYTEAEYSIVLSDNRMSEIINQLRNIITPQWEIPFGLRERADYIWDLYIVLQQGDMIRYGGEGVEEEYRPGFHEWYQNLYREVKDA